MATAEQRSPEPGWPSTPDAWGLLQYQLGSTTPALEWCASESYTLSAVDADLLAVREHDALEADDFLAVGELIAGAGDHVARLHRRAGPAVGFHPVQRGPADHPRLLLTTIGRDVERDHRVPVRPPEVGHGALHGHETFTGHRPLVMSGERDCRGQQRQH